MLVGYEWGACVCGVFVSYGRQDVKQNRITCGQSEHNKTIIVPVIFLTSLP